MLMPENASLCGSFLHLPINPEPDVEALVDKTRRAASAVTETWIARTKGHPLIELTAVRLEPNGAESGDALSLERIDQTVSESGRVILEGPAGGGKTTTLIQLAGRRRNAGTPFIVDLPAWTSSGQGILDFIAGMRALRAEGLTPADLARVQQTEPFLLLLNGWNEIAESNSARADDALRQLERDFPTAGIIVATRTHHLVPPLPGALRVRLLHLRRAQRTEYLEVRLGAEGAALRARIDADPSLDELTRTPFVLSEVASLFEDDAEIPSVKFAVLAEVLRLHEQRGEHRNPLQTAPIFGHQTDYLEALATEMIRRGAVALPEADARTVVSGVARELADRGQIEGAGAPMVLATLAAHHVLERVDYPAPVFRFDHQQLQEYYAAFDLRAELLDLQEDGEGAIDGFTADYVNNPAWAEPLRMIAETLSHPTGNDETDGRNIRAGGMLVEMALVVDLVFAGELVQRCGVAVWDEVRAVVGERLRAVNELPDGNYRQYATAAMLATGSDDFSDIIVPLLSSPDQQTRLRTLRLWPDIRLSSLGSNWRERVRGWSEEARTEFVSELLHHRVDGEIALYAVEDDSAKVKMAAVSGLIWVRADDLLIRVLESMNAQSFEEVARKYPGRIPPVLKDRVVAAMRDFIERTADQPARLRTALELISLGEPGLDVVVKDAMAALPGGEMRNLAPRYIRPALEHLRETDPDWTREWVVTQVAEGVLYEPKDWLPFADAVPDDAVERCMHRVETEDLRNSSLEGMTEVIATQADSRLAARVFVKLRELRRRVDSEPGERHEFEQQAMRQLKSVFHRLPDDVAADGVLSSVASGDLLDVNVAADLLSRIARSELESLRVEDDNLNERLRVYLKSSVNLVLRSDDFDGEEKANLASAIAQVGRPEDMADLVTLVRADIERLRRGRADRAAGDHGPLGMGSIIPYARRHVAAVMHLDPVGAEQVLIDFLREPEYAAFVAWAMARDFLPKQERHFDRTIRYDVMWAARDGGIPPPGDDQRRTRFAVALNAEIERLREEDPDAKRSADRFQLAKALAAVDGRGSAEAVVGAISVPNQRHEYSCLDAAERLLLAGVMLPAHAAFAVVDSILERTEEWMNDSDRDLLCHALTLCPFVDDPAAGIAKMRDTFGRRQLRGHELRRLVTALGESRSEAAVDLLYEIASDTHTFEPCEDHFYNAFATLDTPRAREVLLGFVDPDIDAIKLMRRPDREDVLVARLTELAERNAEAAARLRDLCHRDLPEINREILSKVMGRLGTEEALFASLNLLDDARAPSVPHGVRKHLEGAFVERKPYEGSPNTFTLHARASNELRNRLLRMAVEDDKRRNSAFMVLGLIEVWRLEFGRPTSEPRHPDLASGQSWPPIKL